MGTHYACDDCGYQDCRCPRETTRLPKVGTPRTPIETLVATVEQATKDLEKASAATAQARSAETGCLNRLNAAQKALDEAIAKLRQEAHRDSDWRAKARRGQSADL